MGVFAVEIEVGDLEGRRVERIEAWVDTGGFYTSLPRPLLESLGVVPEEREHFVLADGRIVESDIGQMRMRIGARRVVTLVIFAEPDSPPLLGAYSLEGLRLGVDPVNQRLVPLTRLLLAEVLPA